MIEFVENADRKEQICRDILTALPDRHRRGIGRELFAKFYDYAK